MANKLKMEKKLLSPLFFVLLFYIFSSKPYVVIASSTEEANALLKWKSSFANQTQSLLPSWTLPSHNASTTPCSWFGISCNSAGSVYLISMAGFGLNGTLREFSFSSFPHLEYLDLSTNQFSGEIPSEIGLLTNLKALTVGENQLNGRIPASLGNLNDLTILSLDNNSLSGFIPSEIGNLKSLFALILSSNNLSGSIPPSFGGLINLKFLDLSRNQLSGSIPSEKGIELPWKKLQILDLRSNLLQGPLLVPPLTLEYLLFSNNKFTGDIPHSICNVRYLQVINLAHNNLSGVVPECIGQFNSNLIVLDLKHNGFNGTIPGSFTKENQLQTLNFNGNGFEGPVPHSLVDCKMLQVLDLGNNKLTDTFPYWLGTLPNLQVLVLRSNKFYGFLRDSEAKNLFSNLRIVDLSNNNFSGFLPTNYFASLKAIMKIDRTGSKLEFMGSTGYQDSISVTIKGFQYELVKILTIFTTIDFSNNSFCGEIPESIGKLQSLHLLNFSKNLLTGHIPSSLGNLTALESLDLSSNRLVGEIPRQLASITFLAVLNLSRNQLSGPIPQGSQFNTFGNDSYSDNLGLCGFPVSNYCEGDENETPQPSSPLSEDDTKYGFVWKVGLMGYGCGMVLGIIMGYLVFSTGNPHWLVRLVQKENTRKVRRQRKIKKSVAVNAS